MRHTNTPIPVRTFEDHVDALHLRFSQPLWGQDVLSDITDPANPVHLFIAPGTPLPRGHLIITAFDQQPSQAAARLRTHLANGIYALSICGGWAGPLRFARLNAAGNLDDPQERTLTGVGEWALLSELERPRQAQ